MKLYDSDATQEYLLDGRYLVKPLIKCKDCKYYEPKNRNFSCNLFSDLGTANNDDDFCAWAEREEK